LYLITTLCDSNTIPNMDAAAVEEMLANAAAASKREKEVNADQGNDEKDDRRPDRSSVDRRRRDRSSDRGSRRDRERSSDRNRRDRSPDRNRRDRSSDRRRRDRSRTPDRYRRRSPDRGSRRNRDRSRDRSPVRSRRERGRSASNDVRSKREPREKSPEVDREELRRQREIDDLTKDQRTIFVSQLTKKVTEGNLRDFFGEIGKVKNIIMLRDKITGAHKGFAYVEMAELESIPNCLLFNSVVPDFQKFPILVKASEAEKNFLAKKDPSSLSYEPQLAQIPGLDNSSPETRLYVGNIHISVDEASLRSLLETFGPLESVKLQRDHMGNSKGYAFIKYVAQDSAIKASNGLPGIEIMGRPLKVGPVIDGSAHNVASAGGGSTGENWKLDADEGGAFMQLNSSSRLALMAKLGAAAGLTVPTIPIAPMPDQQHQMMMAASAAAPGASSVIPQITGVPSVNLLICNMFDPATETEPDWDQDIREDMLEECSKFGQVETVYVEKVKPGGIVLVKFGTVDASMKGAMSMNGRFFAGRMITASYVDDATFNTLMM